MADETITINGIPYPTSSLSENARNQVASLRYVDRRIAELERDIAVLKTARNAYSGALARQLPQVDNQDQERH